MKTLAIRSSSHPPEESTPLGRGIGPVKRVFDVLLSVAALLVLAPLFLVVAIAIRIDSPGPVFYRQDRVGMNRRARSRRLSSDAGGEGGNRRRADRRQDDLAGRIFYIWKFRSMRQDAEKSGKPVWASRNDPRVTRVGAFLRKSRLDELPQLWNILKGEMSLVGPRPERPYFVKRLQEKFPGYRSRLNVPPGLTGLAQIERAYDEDEDDVRRKLAYDLFYIEHRHFLVDMKIIAQTIGVVLNRKGAR